MLATLWMAPAAHAGLADWNGHLAVGYAKLVITDAPAGSISLSSGVDRPFAARWSAGVDIGYHLLGTRTVVRGSLFANVDYSVFEVLALVHWTPPRGPFQLSAGPGMFVGHADLSTAGGGAAFSDLAVSKTAAGAAANAMLIQRSTSLLKVGLEVGTRVGFLPHDTWTLGVARVSVHY